MNSAPGTIQVAQAFQPAAADTAVKGHATGFTLTELLIAVGILGVGMTIMAVIFAAGIGDVQVAVSTSGSQMIASQGKSAAERKLKASNITSTSLVVLASPAVVSLISADEQKSPQADANAIKGFILFGRNITTGTQQLVSVAYRRSSTGVAAMVGTISAQCSGTNLVVASGGTYLRVGTPVIAAETGDYARLIRIEGTTYTLDRPIGNLSGGVNKNAFVIYESGSATGDPSPSENMAVLVTTTSLP
ncbi:MAG: prepilin-type N-terminal cleavage/methylation domain-containing protein [Phycisphaerae bacterium]